VPTEENFFREFMSRCPKNIFIETARYGEKAQAVNRIG
jgi:hypothetical protein